jgi:alkylhydroperoxidase family enzyme
VLASDDPTPALPPGLLALWRHAHKVTLDPAACTRDDVAALRAAGCSDAQISAAVQVVAYFNYINRIADALGVDLEPDMS